MYCSKCGNQLADDDRFCPNCGTPVEAQEAENPADEATDAPKRDEAELAGDAAFEPKTPEPPTTQLPVIDPEPQPQAAAQNAWQAGAPRPQQAQASVAAQAQGGAKKGLGAGAKAAIVIVIIAVVVAAAVAIGYFALQQNRTVEVSFETDGGSTVAAEQVKPGEHVNSPANPEKSGYRFDGWYTDAQHSKKVSFPYEAPDYDVTIFAKWTKMSEGDTDREAGETSNTYTSTDSTNSALKGYFADMKTMSGRIATAAKHFNANFKKGPNARQKVEDELGNLTNDIYDTLGDGYETSWKVTSMDVPASMANVRDKMGTASDRLLDRITCMQQALSAIDGMYDPTSSQIDEAIGGYMQQSHDAYKEYKKLERSIENSLG